MGVCAFLGLDWKHLCPINEWTENKTGPSYQDKQSVSQYVIDQTTGELYFNSTKALSRCVCALEATFGTILHSVALVVGTVYCIFRVLSFYAFWREDSSGTRNLQSRFVEWASDAVRILISPLAIPCLFLSALYGIARPQDGKKLHARMEILFHGHPLIALCMHPQPIEASYNNKHRKLQAMITSTLLVQPVKLVISIVYKIIRFLSFYSLWKRDNKNMSEKCINWIKDGLGILATPLGIPLSLIAGILAVVTPEKGVLLFHNVQKVCYGEAFADDDFNIIPIELREHFFGGNANHRNAY